MYRRGKSWWIGYSWHGEKIRESAFTDNKKVALKKLDERLEQLTKPAWAGPQEDRWTLTDMLEVIKAEYARFNRRSFKNVEYCFEHLKDHFGLQSLASIGSNKGVDTYQRARLETGAQRSTINREVAYLRHGFKIMCERGELTTMPVIKLLGDENVRRGFIDAVAFRRILENISATDALDVIEFLYNSGWRSREAMNLQWEWVDINAKMIRLPPEFSKNKEGRSLPIVGALADIIERRVKVRRLDCPFVFHRQGTPIRSFRKVFKTAVSAAGLPGIIPHDMRRSAVRNFRKAGLSVTEGMKLSGHKTDSVYRRYDIIDENDLAESMTKVQEHLERERQSSNVVRFQKRA